MKKPTIKDTVFKNKDLLTTLGYKQLIDWGKSAGYDNRSAFARYKKALAGINIDFDAKKYEARSQSNEASKEVFFKNLPTHKITLYSDAKAKNNRFAICNEEGDPVWYGSFFESCVQEQSAEELAAAKKAIYLADKVFEDEDIVHGDRLLVLKVDAEWLTWGGTKIVDKYSKSGGKARALAFMADKCGIFLKVEHVAGSENPADEYTVSGGYEKWSDNTHLVDIDIVERNFFTYLK